MNINELKIKIKDELEKMEQLDNAAVEKEEFVSERQRCFTLGYNKGYSDGRALERELFSRKEKELAELTSRRSSTWKDFALKLTGLILDMYDGVKELKEQEQEARFQLQRKFNTKITAIDNLVDDMNGCLNFARELKTCRECVLCKIHDEINAD